MKVMLIDSPVANIANISRALRAAGADLEVSSDEAVISRAAKLVLPGVGSFPAAMKWLTANAIDNAIRTAVSSGAALLGVCVGHQLLFDRSLEMGSTAGLGLISGEVRRLECKLPIPQIGWNRVNHNGSALFEGVESGAPFYFVNSFATPTVGTTVARSTYGAVFTAAVQQDRIFGVQFHPEKSSTAGLRVLRNFVSLS